MPIKTQEIANQTQPKLKTITPMPRLRLLYCEVRSLPRIDDMVLAPRPLAGIIFDAATCRQNKLALETNRDIRSENHMRPF